MKIFSALRSRAAGFTMIELLIVIAILGILAVAVLAAINPIEQINRGRDTGTRSDAEQLISAIDRFNAFKGYNPWVTNPGDDFTQALVLLEPSNPWEVNGLVGCTVLERLSIGDGAVAGCDGTDELKTSFTQRVMGSGYNYLSVYNGGQPGNSTYVCFEPKSKAFMDEAITRCNDTALLPADYPALGSVCDTDSSGVTNAADDVMICLP